MENFKELYAYSKDAFNREYERFKNTEAKAAQYLSVLTLLVGAAGFFGKWVVDNFVPPRNSWEAALLVLAALIIASVLTAWFQIFSVLIVLSLETPPLNDEVLDFFAHENDDRIYYTISSEFKEALHRNRLACNGKVSRLVKAYYAILVSVILLVFFCGAFGAYNWIVKPARDMNMPKSNDTSDTKPTAPTTPSEPVNKVPQPSSDKTFPAFDKVENGGKPPVIRDAEPIVTFET